MEVVTPWILPPCYSVAQQQQQQHPAITVSACSTITVVAAAEFATSSLILIVEKHYELLKSAEISESVTSSPPFIISQNYIVMNYIKTP